MAAIAPCSVQKQGFLGTRPSLRRTVRSAAKPARMNVQANLEYPSNWLPKNGIVPIAGFLGWTIPSSIPVPALGGSSLFSKFTEEIGIHLAQFPKGPPLDDVFWLYMITWHVGLFTTLLLGQIGVQGRKQGYW